MKKHLIKHNGLIDDYGWCVTYCGMHSEKWSGKFIEDLDKYLVKDIEDCTCKNCLKKI